MTEEFLNESLTIRDEYFHTETQFKGEVYWCKLIQLAKDGNINTYLEFCVLPDPNNNDCFVDECGAYFVWMYYRGPFRDEMEGKGMQEPYEDIINMNPFKFAQLLNDTYTKMENQLP